MPGRARTHDDCAGSGAHDNSLIHHKMLAIAHRAATALHGALPTLACAAGVLLRTDSIHHENSGIPHRAVARPFRAASILFRAVRIVAAAAARADFATRFGDYNRAHVTAAA